VLNSRDITERKLAELALDESEKRYRGLWDDTPIGLYRTTLDGQYVDVNQAGLDILRISGEELSRVNASEFWAHPEERKRLVEEIGGKDVIGFEFEMRRRDGSTFWVYNTVKIVRDDQGQVLFMGGSFQDITARKEAEETLARSEAELRKVQKAAHLGTWTWNIRTNQLEWSDEMFQIFGVDRQPFSGSLADVMTTVIHPDDRAMVEASNNSVIREKRPIPLEYRIVWPDGSNRTVWAVADELFLDEDGNPAVLKGFVQDITDRKMVEGILNSSQNRDDIDALNAISAKSNRRPG
jgi:PAS domain S-box-containing protein